MERYRSGHNGPDSKSGVGQPTVGSNPTRSAKLIGSAIGTPYWFVWNSRDSKPVVNRSGGSIYRAGFFVAGREDGGVSRLRDPMREKGIPPAPPRKASKSLGFLAFLFLSLPRMVVLKMLDFRRILHILGQNIIIKFSQMREQKHPVFPVSN